MCEIVRSKKLHTVTVYSVEFSNATSKVSALNIVDRKLNLNKICLPHPVTDSLHVRVKYKNEISQTNLINEMRVNP